MAAKKPLPKKRIKKQAEPSIAIIGCGNVGGALLFALAKHESFRQRKIIACDIDVERAEELAQEFGVTAEHNPYQALQSADITVLAMRPNATDEFLTIGRRFKNTRSKVIISTAVGISLTRLEKAFPGAAVARVMPNLPMAIGLGMTSIYAESEKAASAARELFDVTGLTIHLERESELDVAMALASCGPAFLYTALEAIVDGGVFSGLSRETAELLAAQMMLGSAALLLEGSSTAADLRERVATPGGTTIEGLYELERAAVRGTYMKAIGKAVRKAQIIRENLEGVE